MIRFDESPMQFIGEACQPIPVPPDRPHHYEYEYRRNERANLSGLFDAHRSWREVKATDRRTAVDCTDCMRHLVNVRYPNANRISVVLDKLASHSPGGP